MLKVQTDIKQSFLEKIKKDPDWELVRDEPLTKRTLNAISQGGDQPHTTGLDLPPKTIGKRALKLLKKMDSRISTAAIVERQHWNPDSRIPTYIGGLWHIPFYAENLLFDGEFFALAPHAKQFAKELGLRSELLANAIKDKVMSHDNAVKIVNGYMKFFPADSVATFIPLSRSNTILKKEQTVVRLTHAGFPTIWEFELDRKTGRVLRVNSVSEDR